MRLKFKKLYSQLKFYTNGTEVELWFIEKTLLKISTFFMVFHKYLKKLYWYFPQKITRSFRMQLWASRCEYSLKMLKDAKELFFSITDDRSSFAIFINFHWIFFVLAWVSKLEIFIKRGFQNSLFFSKRRIKTSYLSFIYKFI